MLNFTIVPPTTPTILLTTTTSHWPLWESEELHMLDHRKSLILRKYCTSLMQLGATPRNGNFLSQLEKKW
jgi:hypothetical protein